MFECRPESLHPSIWKVNWSQAKITAMLLVFLSLKLLCLREYYTVVCPSTKDGDIHRNIAPLFSVANSKQEF